MATYNFNEQLTITELAKRQDPNGSLATIAENLAKDNAILMDAVYKEANDGTTNVGTIRDKLPTGTWRKINAGVDTEASQTKEVRDVTGMLEAYSEVDKALAMRSGNVAQFRHMEDMAFIEGMSQTLASTLIYGNNDTDPEKFDGLAPRYNAIDGYNVWNNGGTGSDLSSAWIVQWHPNEVFKIFPKGSKSLGVTHSDLGEDTTTDANSKKYQIYRSHFSVESGLVVLNPRRVKRIANIETAGTSNTLDIDVIVKALRKMPNNGAGSVIYMNSTLLAQLDILAKDKTNVQYYADSPFGQNVTMIRGIPVRQVDAILDTESALS